MSKIPIVTQWLPISYFMTDPFFNLKTFFSLMIVSYTQKNKKQIPTSN